MAYALVGTIGVASQGTVTTAVTPAWGTGESRTANNLLICFVSVTGSATLPTTPSGWSIGKQVAGTSCSATIYYKIAAGADATPTIASITSGLIAAQLAEFSGNATTTPLDQTGSATGTSSPITATNGAVDTASGELLLISTGDIRSVARATADTLTSNNATITQAGSNNGTSSVNHYSFGYGNTTSKAAADTAVMTASLTNNITGFAVVAATFKRAAQTTSQSFTPTCSPTAALQKKAALSRCNFAGMLMNSGVLPNTVSGLKVWLKADALALSDGAAVATWTDSSGNSNSPTQATSGSRPTFRLTGGPNSLPCVEFDNTDDQLANTFVTGTLTQPYTVIAVYDIGRVLDGSPVNRITLGAGGAGGDFSAFAGIQVNGPILMAANKFRVHSAVFNGSSSQLLLDHDSVLAVSMGTNSLNNIIIQPAAIGEPQNSKVLELCIYSGALSDKDLHNVIQGQIVKWRSPTLLGSVAVLTKSIRRGFSAAVSSIGGLARSIISRGFSAALSSIGDLVTNYIHTGGTLFFQSYTATASSVAALNKATAQGGFVATLSSSGAFAKGLLYARQFAATLFGGSGGSPTIDDSYPETNYSNSGIVSSIRTRWGQTFVSSGGTLTKAQFYVFKSASPTGNCFATLWSVSAGLPATVLATSGVVDTATLSSYPPPLTDFNFTGVNQYNMAAGTTYAIVFEWPTAPAGDNLRVGLDDSSPTHSGEQVVEFFGSWGATTSDTLFYVYVAGGGAPAATLTRLPQKALSATLSFVGAFAQSFISGSHAFTQALSATLSSTAALTRSTSHLLTATLSFVGKVTKLSQRVLSAALNLNEKTDDFYSRNFDSAVSIGNPAQTAIAQTFVSSGGTLSASQFLVRYIGVGAATGNALAKLYSVSTGLPNTLLATSDPVVASTISSSVASQWIRFNFSGAARINLSAGTTYAISFEYTGTASILMRVWTDGTTLAHPGSCSVFTTVWTPLASNDLCFYLFVSPDGTLVRAVAKALTATLSFAGAASRLASKALSATLSFVGAMVKRSNRTLAATLSFVGSFSERNIITRAFTATLSFAGSVSRRTAKALAATLSFVGSITLRTSHLLTATLSFVGAVTKRSTRFLAATLSFTGLQTASKSFLKSLTATLSFVGAMSPREILTRAFTATLAFSGSVTRFPQKAFTATLSFVGNLQKSSTRFLTATLSFVGAATKRATRALSATLSFIGTHAFNYIHGGIQFTQNLVATLSFVGTFNAKQILTRAFTATLNATGAVTRSIGKALSASLFSTGATTLLDSYDETNQSSTGTLRAGSATAVVQSITGGGKPLSSATFYIRKLGNPPGNVVAKLYTHTGTFGVNSIPGSLIDTSNPILASNLTTTLALVSFDFPNKPALDNGTKYCLGFEYAIGDAANAITFGTDNTSPTHPGNYAHFIGAGWSFFATNDLIFYAYVGSWISFTKAIIDSGFSATLSFTAALVKFFRDAGFTATLSFVGNLVGAAAHFFTRAFTATLSFSAALTRFKLAQRVFAATLAFSATLRGRTAKVFAATLSFSTAARKLVRKVLRGTLAFATFFFKGGAVTVLAGLVTRCLATIGISGSTAKIVKAGSQLDVVQRGSGAKIQVTGSTLRVERTK